MTAHLSHLGTCGSVRFGSACRFRQAGAYGGLNVRHGRTYTRPCCEGPFVGDDDGESTKPRLRASVPVVARPRLPKARRGREYRSVNHQNHLGAGVWKIPHPCSAAGVRVCMMRVCRGQPPTEARGALPIEQSTPGFANSRVRAPPHVHPRGLGSRPSSLRGLNEEFLLKKVKNKKVTAPGRLKKSFCTSST